MAAMGVTEEIDITKVDCLKRLRSDDHGLFSDILLDLDEVSY